MMRDKTYYVYIMSNQSRTLYIGITSNIQKRAWQHKCHQIEGFTRRYNVGALVYVEMFNDVSTAISREKQLKHWSRKKKLWLIDQQNPEWRDLSDGWYD